MSSIRLTVAILFLTLMVLTGCAFDIMDIRYAPVGFEQSRQEEGRSWVLTSDISLQHAPCGYRRTLRKGTRWKLVGALPQGEVFKSDDQVLTLECANVFEAYLVVSGRQLIGFYLPVEKGFVAASKPLHLPIDQ